MKHFPSTKPQNPFPKRQHKSLPFRSVNSTPMKLPLLSGYEVSPKPFCYCSRTTDHRTCYCRGKRRSFSQRPLSFISLLQNTTGIIQFSVLCPVVVGDTWFLGGHGLRWFFRRPPNKIVKLKL